MTHPQGAVEAVLELDGAARLGPSILLVLPRFSQARQQRNVMHCANQRERGRCQQGIFQTQCQKELYRNLRYTCMYSLYTYIIRYIIMFKGSVRDVFLHQSNQSRDLIPPFL